MRMRTAWLAVAVNALRKEGMTHKGISFLFGFSIRTSQRLSALGKDE